MADHMDKVYFKSYPTEKGMMIAMCDSELLGKTFTEGKKEIDLERYADFYKGELMTTKAAVELAGKDVIFSANVVGERSVNAFIKMGLVSKAEVMTIAGIPIVHLYRTLG